MFRRNSCRRKHAKTAAAGIIYWPRRIYGQTVLRFFRFDRNTIVVAVFRLIMNQTVLRFLETRREYDRDGSFSLDYELNGSWLPFGSRSKRRNENKYLIGISFGS